MLLSLFSMHAFTGCDTLFICEERQETAWILGKVFLRLTHAFEELLLMQKDISY